MGAVEGGNVGKSIVSKDCVIISKTWINRDPTCRACTCRGVRSMSTIPHSLQLHLHLHLHHLPLMLVLCFCLLVFMLKALSGKS